MDDDFKYKYGDSFLYEWAYGRADKPIHYLVLIASDSLSAGDLMNRTDRLKRQLPLQAPAGSPFARPLAAGCAVFNIEAWNKRFPQYPVSRLSNA